MPEQKETRLIKPDFVAEFRRRLNAITPLSEQAGKYEAFAFWSLGIFNVKRKGVAVLFAFDDATDTVPDFWIEDPNSIDNDYPHSMATENLDNFLFYNAPHLLNSFVNKGHGYIYQDREGKLYFEPSVEYIEFEIEQSKEFADSVGSEKWLNLLRTYKVEAILGLFRLSDKEKEEGIKSRLALNQKIASKIREDEFLMNLAKRNGLTITQYLRLRCLGKTADEQVQRAVKSGESIVLFDKNQLAKEIKEDPAENI